MDFCNALTLSTLCSPSKRAKRSSHNEAKIIKAKGVKLVKERVIAGGRVGNYWVTKLLASTARAQLYVATHETTNATRVVKIISHETPNQQRDLEEKDSQAQQHQQQRSPRPQRAKSGEKKKEFKMMALLQGHENILPLYEVVQGPERTSLVIHHCEGGDLWTYTTRASRRRVKVDKKRHTSRSQSHFYGLSRVEAWRIFKQLVAAAGWMHRKGFAHRDIKPENVFLDASGKVFLGDFGFTTRCGEDGTMKNRSCGTLQYAAPELLKAQSYRGPEIDSWALGVTLFFILNGCTPFNAENEYKIYRKIRHGSYRWTTGALCDGEERNTFFLWDLVEGLLQDDPKKRSTMGEVAVHPWLAEPPLPSTEPSSSETVWANPPLEQTS